MGLETLAMVAIIAASGVSAYSSIQAGKEAKFAGEQDAQLMEQEAVVTQQQTAVEVDAIRDRNDRIAATQRTSFLKSGITLEGTAEDVMYDTALEGELEALNTQYRGNVSSQFSRKSAAISRYSGAAKQRSYNLQAVGSVLQGTGSALSIASNPKFGSKTP